MKGKKIPASFDTPILLKPGKDKHGFYLEIGAEGQYGGKCITPGAAKQFRDYLSRFIKWTEQRRF